MKNIEIVSEVKNGRLVRNRPLLNKAIKSFEGKQISILIKVKGKKRSNPQNAFYWGVVVQIWKNILLTEWGEFYSDKEVHEFLKYNCNFIEKLNEKTGEIVRLSKSTKENTTTDQEIFHERARILALEMFNTEIPLPNTEITLKL